MKIGILFLCRYNSSRLPGKILKPLAGKPMIQHIHDKLLLVAPKETIYVTTSEEPSDDIIAEYCKEHEMNCYRGELENLSNRFLAAAKDLNFDFVTRINGDAPFINMHMLAEMLEICRTDKYDFITNVKNRTFPVGMSAEILRTSFYEEIQPQIQADKYYWEHVTSLLYKQLNIGKRYYLFNTKNPELTGGAYAVDEKEDYLLAQRIVEKLGDNYYNCTFNQFSEVIQQLKHEYELEGKAWTFTYSGDRG